MILQLHKKIKICYSKTGDNMEIRNANTFLKKFKGLMFVKKFNYILKFKANGIHTFFMKINIDIVLTDKNNNILYIYENVKPNKIILPKKNVKYTYEMPAGTLKKAKDIFHL